MSYQGHISTYNYTYSIQQNSLFSLFYSLECKPIQINLQMLPLVPTTSCDTENAFIIERIHIKRYIRITDTLIEMALSVSML